MKLLMCRLERETQSLFSGVEVTLATAAGLQPNPTLETSNLSLPSPTRCGASAHAAENARDIPRLTWTGFRPILIPDG
jgi:hypothetical protein